MYNTLKIAIMSGNYELSDMAQKIDTMYVANRITYDEREELMQLCIDNLNIEYVRPEVMDLIESLAARVSALEEAVANLNGNGAGGVDLSGYPEWKPWDGMSSDYQNGAIVYHADELWISTYPSQNIWEPGVIGTENMWVKYNPQEEATAEEE